ncbi:uncharacterized protein LOC141595473 [Silene latifolia]|uniref:uncharacterized protein LOC141595473 n=1 Tax=Silene latifolia TaxID=37657 RepID=UPI003D787017
MGLSLVDTFFDNILLSHEILHHISNKRFGKRGLSAVKVDMSKAYDRLDWNFIKCTLLSMKFPSKFVDLIMNCVTTVSYEVLINGSSGKSFRPKAGIRQGDPLSSYLFALCTEVLSQLLCDAQDKKLIKGIRISREAPPISHLLFADDSIFFMDARASDCGALMVFLNQYGDAPGQRINEAKTTITTSPNCTLRNYRDCLKILKAPGNKGMGKYLGLPTDFGASKKEIFAMVIDKVRSRIQSWNNNYLSSAGRLTLINSVLSSLSVFSLSVFKMPVSVSSKINSLLSQFWRGGTIMKRSLHWCSNLFISASKSGGGLSIRNIGCLNQSLLAEIGWKILVNPTSLISKVLGPKFKLSPDTIFSSSFATTGTRSWGERGIRWGIQLLRENLAWQVGFPSLLDVWKDKWIYGLSLGQLLGLSDHEINEKPSLNVCQLQTAIGDWDVDAVFSICGNIMAPYILALPLAAEDFDDSLYWTLIKTDKWKTFLWKLLSNSLPIGTEASKRNLPWSYQCKLAASFDNHLESLEHLFRDRSITSHIRRVPIRHSHSNGAIFLFNHGASAGWLFQDSHGVVFHTGQFRFWPGSALQAEATTFFHALRDATNRGFWHIDAQTDCLRLVLHLADCTEVQQELKTLLRSIFHVLASCHCCSISHCPRILNRTAHRLATSAMR